MKPSRPKPPASAPSPWTVMSGSPRGQRTERPRSSQIPEQFAARERWIETALSVSRAVMLMFVLWQVTDVWLWPHVYMAKVKELPAQLGKFQGAVEVLSFLVTMAHARYLPKVARYGWPIALYCAYLFLHEMFHTSGANDLLREYGFYLQCFMSLGLILYIDGPRRLLRWFIIYSMVFTVVNYASLAVPQISVMRGGERMFANQGLLRGFLPQKNDLSSCALIFALICAFDIDHSLVVNRATNITAAVALLGLLLLGGSVQGVLLLIFLSALGAFLVFRSRFGPYLSMFIAGLLGAAILAMGFAGGLSLNSVLEHFGRDSTLTGRTSIWAYFYDIAMQRKWSGYGIGQWFQSVDKAEKLSQANLPITINSTHSAYLEAFLSFGIPGAFLFYCLCAFAAYRIVISIKKSDDYVRIIGILLCILSLIGGISAAEKLFLPSIGWFTFSLGFLLLGPLPVRPDLQRARPKVAGRPQPRRRVGTPEA